MLSLGNWRLITITKEHSFTTALLKGNPHKDVKKHFVSYVAIREVV